MLRLSALVLVLSACAPESGAPVTGTTTFSTSVPAAILCQRDGGVRCDRMRAELYVSGYLQADGGGCALTVNEDTCEVSGTCPSITPRRRQLTLDYFVKVEDVRVLLAQATKDVDLTSSAQVTFTEADLVPTAACQLMPGCDNSARTCPGFQVVWEDGGVAQPVCDLDADAYSNLDELCGGTDPLR